MTASGVDFPIDQRTAFLGNFLIIDHGTGELSLFAHLEKGSFRIRPGDLLDTTATEFDVIVAGDAFYNREMTARVLAFLARASAGLVLAGDLKRPTLDVAVQEDFGVGGGLTLEKLDDYIKACDGVVHLIGKATGANSMTRELGGVFGIPHNIGIN